MWSSSVTRKRNMHSSGGQLYKLIAGMRVGACRVRLRECCAAAGLVGASG